MTSTEKGRCICPLKFVNYYRNHMTSCPLHIATPISDDRWVEGKVAELSEIIEHDFHLAVKGVFEQIRGEITEEQRVILLEELDANSISTIRNALLEAEKRGREML